MEVFRPTPSNKLILNLPATVEMATPNIYADQIEWFSRNIKNRDSIILSLHPHNDRGTGVAAAELGVMAGADRIEGTLFGNGERTGNVCLATVALNLFSQGVDPQLDFSDIDEIRRTVAFCNQIPVHVRHPYVGDLVYTAFSGTHQDAIAKGLAAIAGRAARAGVPAAALPWEAPYLPIDPVDVGRTYESVVRVNSQSGKGGIAHMLKTGYGVDLPRGLRVELAERVQRIADTNGTELDSRQLWEVFHDEYLRFDRPQLLLKEFRATETDGRANVAALIVRADGAQAELAGSGTDPMAAFVDALAHDGLSVELIDVSHQVVADPGGTRTVAYAEIRVDGQIHHGVGMDRQEQAALIGAVVSGVNRRWN
jgi:2-isopropylmalate synthase